MQPSALLPVSAPRSSVRLAGGAARARLVTLALFALFAVLGLMSRGALAQPNLRLERFNFEKVPDVKVYLSFVEEDGTVIGGKNAQDFKLQVDSVDQGGASNLTSFDQLKEPLFVMAVVQVSGVVNERALSEVKQGLRRVNEAVGNSPGGRMGILAYADKVNRIIEFGTSSEVDSALSKVSVETEASESHMLDALRTAIDLLKQQEKGRRKLIILFSDGIDVNNEKKGFTDIGTRAQQAGIIIDTVGFNEFDPPKLKNLKEMTKRCYGTDRVAKVVTEIGSRVDAIVDELNKQYVITFPLSIAGDDQDHIFQAVHEAGGRPLYSNNFTEKLPSKPVVQKETPKGDKSRLWLWLLLAAAVIGAIVAAILLRKKPQADAPAPMPSPKADAPAPRMSNKTVALDAAGEVAMGWVMGLTGKYKDQTFKLKDRTVIGTAADCDIVIEDGFMSQRHAEIRKVEGGFKIVDLGATNPIIVNDKRVKEHFLVDNDSFRLGRTEFKFKSIFS